MPFCSVGEFRTVLQQYKYEAHKICCVIRILPDKVSYFGKEPENDFSWMTAARWTKLENSLWRIFGSITNWKQDAHQLKTELLVDHIQVSIRATQEFLSASQKLLKNDALSQNDLGLEIVLKYMSHEDSTVVSAQAAKRKSPQQENGSRHSVASSSTHKNKAASKNSDSDKAKRAKLQDNEREPTSSSKSTVSTVPSRKRERRSISHDSHSRKDTLLNINKESTSGDSRSQTPNNLKRPTSSQNADEPKPERRSARSPKKPGHYTEYHLGGTNKNSRSSRAKAKEDSSSDRKPREQSVKIKSVSTAINHKDKEPNNSQKNTAKHWNLEQLDGGRNNVETLKKINEMLEVPKPRKVKILLLKDMDETTVLGTFDKYCEDFDQLFKERQHKFQTISYMTIDHCHIMDILNRTIRERMIKKLGEVYSKSGPHCSLVLNGLLPLWIIRLFMDKYKFSREEAVRQIADQLKYNTYLKAVNNEPLSSDLEN